MTREDILRKVFKCPICKVTYMPENGEICKCDRPEPDEEPRIVEWEDSSITKALNHLEN